MRYEINDYDLQASVFIPFVVKIWPGNYDAEKTQTALLKTINITAYDDELLVGCLRILSDGYYFGTITELLVLPAYQKQLKSYLHFGSRQLPLLCECLHPQLGSFSGS